MATVGEFPAVREAIERLFKQHEIELSVEVAAMEVPEVWRQNFSEAEPIAQRLKGYSVSHFLEHEVIEEDALLYMAVGDTDIVRQLVKIANGASLDEVLDEAYQGQLYRFWQSRYRR